MTNVFVSKPHLAGYVQLQAEVTADDLRILEAKVRHGIVKMMRPNDDVYRDNVVCALRSLRDAMGVTIDGNQAVSAIKTRSITMHFTDDDRAISALKAAARKSPAPAKP